MSSDPANNLPFDALVWAGGFADMTTEEIAAAVGFAPRAVYRWKRSGLTPANADKAAVAIGTHPASVWPGRW
jgi:hypothetical protein